MSTARDVVWNLLKNNLPGIPVEVNYDLDQRPDGGSPFAVLRWGEEDFDIDAQKGLRHFDVYVHVPWSISTDYCRIDEILETISAAFDSANDVDLVGDDNVRLGFIEPEGCSPDLKDESYQTICRYASYKALSSKVG